MEYRELKEGDRLQEGDQYQLNGHWINFDSLYNGMMIESDWVEKYRRPINTVNTATDAKKEAGESKPKLHLITQAALEAEARAMEYGAEKYGERNWLQGDGVEYTVYLSAILRHCVALIDGEDIDKDSRCHHLAHIRAGAGILLDCIKHDKLIDNRSIKLKKE